MCFSKFLWVYELAGDYHLRVSISVYMFIFFYSQIPYIFGSGNTQNGFLNYTQRYPYPDATAAHTANTLDKIK